MLSYVTNVVGQLPLSVTWMSDTFKNNFGLNHHKFTKYLGESCWWVCHRYFSLKRFLKKS